MNTHHHYDHVGGNKELKKLYNAKVIGFDQDKHRIPEIDIFVKNDEIWKDGIFEAKVFHIPGHTLQTVFNTSPPTAYDTMSATSFAATNVDVSITPKYSNSKMIIMCNVHVDTTTGTNCTLAIFKDGTVLTPKSASGSYDGHSYFNRLNEGRLLLMQAVYATDALSLIHISEPTRPY
mgnify:CR=1 FL=1